MHLVRECINSGTVLRRCCEGTQHLGVRMGHTTKDQF